VKLRLGTAAKPDIVDTLVMSNLGYFQLKAAPGVWDLQLAPGGQAGLMLGVRLLGARGSNPACNQLQASADGGGAAAGLVCERLHGQSTIATAAHEPLFCAGPPPSYQYQSSREPLLQEGCAWAAWGEMNVRLVLARSWC
jgi:hypothetical protein